MLVAGQIGCNAQCSFGSDHLRAQVWRAQAAVLAALRQAWAGPEYSGRMTG